MADEAEPPNAPTRVITTSTGVVFANEFCGFRVDWNAKTGATNGPELAYPLVDICAGSPDYSRLRSEAAKLRSQ